ncbi:acetyl-coenzyme A synthetase-like [Tropilaelaps mercedesae]|uniref:Acetyl-coenzyme A synthetase-like n=1 Tax=Tropilaelaps mercedesae TaxID=418985 RepID=A0A1V9X3X7_9ACAR|nr:acetyl-coenzyme A synthetase-like [Tropilaelaps mercedesae]
MAEELYEPPHRVRDVAHLNTKGQYKALYERSIEEPQAFWKGISDEFYWREPVKGKVFNYNINVNNGPVFIKCMEGAQTNIAYNCLDRNVEKGLGDNVAYL